MRRGFSLVELSIVLVILGLLTGGILAGQSLIRAAELRSLTSDIARYRTATLSFRDKYFYYPGDLPNATQFWGIAGGTTGNDVACYDSMVSDGRTCNGNGDGRTGVDGTTQWERYRFWQHLANGGLVEGRYNGGYANGSGATQAGCIIGQGCPGLRILRTGTFLAINQDAIGDVNFVPYSRDNYFLLGDTTVRGYPNDNPIGPMLSPEEAWNVDTKLDDSLPYQGQFQTFYRTGATQWAAADANACANSATISGATYNLTRTVVSCSFRLRLI